jgi:hypothetical protein
MALKEAQLLHKMKHPNIIKPKEERESFWRK